LSDTVHAVPRSPLILQLPRGGALDTELSALGLPSIGSGAVVVEDLPAEAGGELEPPGAVEPEDAGKVVLSLPSPEGLRREPETVRRVIDEAGEGPEPLIVELEVAEHLREDELQVVIEAAARTSRAVILRVMRDG
jgi:hypothetical protein